MVPFSIIPDPLALVLSAAALGQAVLCISLLLSNSGPKPHQRWLSLILAALAALAAGPVSAALYAPLYPLTMGLVLVALYALPSLFWLYARALTWTSDSAPQRPSWKHGLAPLGGMLGLLAILTLPSHARSAMFVSGELDGSGHAAIVAGILFILVLAWTPLSALYAFALQRRLMRYRRVLRDNLSNTEGRDLFWLSGIILVIAAVWCSAIILLVADNVWSGLHLPASLGPVMLLMLILALSLRGLGQDNGFAAIAEDPPTREAPDISVQKYRKSALNEADAARIVERLEQAMQDDRLYLDPNLSLTKLARHVRVASNHVSQTLNEAMNETFFDYVNRWRIEAALPHIVKGQETVLTIALDVGFNTRSTFYTAFKRVTGMTPRAYRAAALDTSG